MTALRLGVNKCGHTNKTKCGLRRANIIIVIRVKSSSRSRSSLAQIEVSCSLLYSVVVIVGLYEMLLITPQHLVCCCFSVSFIICHDSPHPARIHCKLEPIMGGQFELNITDTGDSLSISATTPHPPFFIIIFPLLTRLIPLPPSYHKLEPVHEHSLIPSVSIPSYHSIPRLLLLAEILERQLLPR